MVDIDEPLWLDRQREVSLSDLVRLSNLSEADVLELVEYGALAPLDARSTPPTFSADCVVIVRRACRLRSEFELDTHALALALRFIERIRDLETQLDAARALLPRRYR